MNNEKNGALDAIWQTSLNSSIEKLIMAHLTSKHDLGDKYSSASWKEINSFIDNFEDKWCNLKELEDATQLSQVKIQRVLKGLKDKDLVKSTLKSTRSEKKKKSVNDEGKIETNTKKKDAPNEVVYAVTKKIFEDYAQTINGQKGTMKRTA